MVRMTYREYLELEARLKIVLGITRNIGYVIVLVVILCLPKIEPAVKIWSGLGALQSFLRVIFVVGVLCQEDTCSDSMAFDSANCVLTTFWYIYGLFLMSWDVFKPESTPSHWWLFIVLIVTEIVFTLIFCLLVYLVPEIADTEENAILV